MEAAIIKPGTHPSQAVFLRGKKPVRDYQIGDKIIYRVQGYGAGYPWHYGWITGFCGPENDHIPMVDLV
jgi:hypothetical protein